jgi:cyclopropane fatty-acyl-phospholipid synthase-like methyltransferase
VSSRWYDWLYRIVKWFRVPINWVFGTHRELDQLVESGRVSPGRALDVGCGAGREAIYLAENGFDVIGVDISPTAIGMAQKAALAAGVEADFRVDDVTEMTSVSGKFDLIVDYGTLNDLNEAQRDAYMTHVFPLAAENSHFVLMCFDKKLPEEEIERRFGGYYHVERVTSKSEVGGWRTISIYVMDRLAA